jgi:glycosyltransferase involved in cell wall biosynthesis
MDPIGKQISVVMITRNEEGSVATVIKGIQACVPDAEIVIVDSSSDKTPEIATLLGATVIRQFPAQGYGPAMEKALRSGSREVIVTLDCDNTYPIDKIPLLAAMVLNQGYDLVDASRLRNKPQAMPWVNYLANVFFARIAALLFLRNITDLHSGMRAYRKSMLAELTFQAQGAALPVELLLKPIKLGYKVSHTFIDYHERTGQSTMQPLDSAWWTLKRIFRVRCFNE